MALFIAFVLMLGIVCPALGRLWNTQDLTVRSFNRVSFKECRLDPGKRINCGSYGISEESCYARECCWSPSEEQGVPWCYHSIKTNSKLCTASENAREQCGWMGIRKEQCLASDCCWRPSNKGEAWCIQKVRVPIFSGECGVPDIKPQTFGRVIGGEDAIPHSWPWMVSLQKHERHNCGGSLINHEWILTAAHCYDEIEGLSVVLGAHNVSSGDDESTKVTVAVSMAFQHDKFGFVEPVNGADFGGVKYDYVLMKLKHPVEFNDVISPLCLASHAPSAGQHCYSMGWGVDSITEDFDMTVPDILQQFMSPVVDTSVCNSTDMYNGRIHPTSMCAGYEEGGRANCFGDSGGPLVTRENGRWYQVGIVSWGEPCALAMFPTVYAEVSQMVEWMERIVAEN